MWENPYLGINAHLNSLLQTPGTSPGAQAAGYNTPKPDNADWLFKAVSP